MSLAIRRVLLTLLLFHSRGKTTTPLDITVISCETCLRVGFFWSGNQCWKKCVGDCVGSCGKGILRGMSASVVENLVTSAPSKSTKQTVLPTYSPTSPSEGFQNTLFLIIGVGFFAVFCVIAVLMVKGMGSIPNLAVKEAYLAEGVTNQSAEPYHGLFDGDFHGRGLKNDKLWRISEGEEIYTSVTSDGRSILETGRSVFSEFMSRNVKSAKNTPSFQDSPSNGVHHLSTTRHIFNT